VRRQVAGQQDQVDAVLERPERGGRALAVVGALAVVDVARGGDAYPAFVAAVRGPSVDGDPGRSVRGSGGAHVHCRIPAPARRVAIRHAHG
jgi:hypothetical protein